MSFNKLHILEHRIGWTLGFIYNGKMQRKMVECKQGNGDMTVEVSKE